MCSDVPGRVIVRNDKTESLIRNAPSGQLIIRDDAPLPAPQGTDWPQSNNLTMIDRSTTTGIIGDLRSLETLHEPHGRHYFQPGEHTRNLNTCEGLHSTQAIVFGARVLY
ncbi:uncharacterized protein RAG0_05682 [Rhynchosporium agropyri]|uniref:Uncharacterized protein n=1 Tax=Rhynchosporium agropyri TaxID=914238 RepID=A0A1E1KE65_9HELO|nr:uncharacterized protein RAG0_05682 [Rhynchosporium agropyri]